MRNVSEGLSNQGDNVVADLLSSALLLIWCIVRVPIFLVLAFIEPVHGEMLITRQ